MCIVPESVKWYETALRSVAAAKAAEPMSRELRADIEEEADILRELILAQESEG